MNENDGVVTGSLQPHTSKRRLFLMLAAVLVVLLVGVTVVFLVIRGDDKKQKPAREQVQATVERSYASRDYTGAARTLESQPNAQDPEVQYQIAVAYTNAKDYQKALDIYAKLDKAGKMTMGMAAAAAEIAEQTNDTKLALKYYKQARELAAKSSHPQPQRLKRYDDKIAELEAKQ